MVILYPPLKLNMQISADALALEDAELSRLRVWVRPVLEHRISFVGELKSWMRVAEFIGTTGRLLIFQWLCFGTALFDAAVVLPPANVQNRRDRRRICYCPRTLPLCASRWYSEYFPLLSNAKATSLSLFTHGTQAFFARHPTKESRRIIWSGVETKEH
ncbi:hypothetical protein F5J12DRAFT_926411 [Pisolithus orientalis]|uniref:uncharacterized protein n=1 Tax=Pisolithus orientalis TaxID=936130 RepID=UPI0022248CD4|nr:uncharacterized protein F5J12DRAFT_926411 [Pisolithus orientalis]KAI6012534.1 hypothetical protein F5J12DRAFT_926411 [Pisolithus orientalis]